MFPGQILIICDYPSDRYRRGSNFGRSAGSRTWPDQVTPGSGPAEAKQCRRSRWATAWSRHNWGIAFSISPAVALINVNTDLPVTQVHIQTLRSRMSFAFINLLIPSYPYVPIS